MAPKVYERDVRLKEALRARMRGDPNNAFSQQALKEVEEYSMYTRNDDLWNICCYFDPAFIKYATPKRQSALEVRKTLGLPMNSIREQE